MSYFASRLCSNIYSNIVQHNTVNKQICTTSMKELLDLPFNIPITFRHAFLLIYSCIKARFRQDLEEELGRNNDICRFQYLFNTCVIFIQRPTASLNLKLENFFLCGDKFSRFPPSKNSYINLISVACFNFSSNL